MWQRERPGSRMRRSYAHLFCHKTFSFLGETLWRSIAVYPSFPARTGAGNCTLISLSFQCPLYGSFKITYLKLRDLGHSYPFFRLLMVQTRPVLLARSCALGGPLRSPGTDLVFNSRRSPGCGRGCAELKEPRWASTAYPGEFGIKRPSTAPAPPLTRGF